MTDHELELMGLKKIESGDYEGAYEIDEVKPEYLTPEMNGKTFVYHPYKEDVICFTPEILSVGLCTYVSQPASLDGLKLLHIAKGFDPYDETFYNDYKFIACHGDALKLIEHFPQYVPKFEKEENMPVPEEVREAYEKYLRETSTETDTIYDLDFRDVNNDMTSESNEDFEGTWCYLIKIEAEKAGMSEYEVSCGAKMTRSVLINPKKDVDKILNICGIRAKDLLIELEGNSKVRLKPTECNIRIDFYKKEISLSYEDAPGSLVVKVSKYANNYDAANKIETKLLKLLKADDLLFDIW